MSLSAVLNRSDEMLANSQYSSLPALAVTNARAGSALAA